ncbi:MAG: DUF1553 domain-containing protein [Planctomycetota bacterium]
MALLLSPLLLLFPGSGGDVDFARDVRPILTEHCTACHGPDAAARKADLRLDVSDVERRSDLFGGTAPEIVYRITEADDFELMPPPEHGKPLAADEVETLVAWIEAGAPYEKHWAFEAPRKASLPNVDTAELPAEIASDWAEHPIDRFVLERLLASGLTPAPPADRRSLARRLSLDLTGLPPEPGEVDAFVHDEAPDAYERLVERWMSGPEWGEHRARHWLDVARYADTHGIHFDNYRDIWPYRDWVIEAFSQDLPYDEFSIQQLAGDLLPDPSIEERVATGFLRCNITTNEGGLIDEEYKVLYARDRTETFGQAWLGLTVGCAVCHDHKYDPLTQREFYELSSFFDNTTVPVRDGNVQDPGPILRVTAEEDRGVRAELEAKQNAARTALDMRAEEAEQDLASWLTTGGDDGLKANLPSALPHLWLPLREGEGRMVTGKAQLAAASDAISRPVNGQLEESAAWISGGPLGAAVQLDGLGLSLPDAGDFEGDEPFTTSAWVRVDGSEPTGALWSRMDVANGYRGWDVWLKGRRVGAHVIHDYPRSWLKAVAKEPLPVDAWTHVTVSYDGSEKASGVRVYYDGVPQAMTIEGDQLKGTTRTTVALTLGTRTGGNRTSPGLCDLRIDRGALEPRQVEAIAQEARIEAGAKGGLTALDEGSRASLLRWWLRTKDLPWQEIRAELEAHGDAIAVIDGRSPTAHVYGERSDAPMAYILSRGEYDRRLDKVGAATPAFLPPLRDADGGNRLALARWLFQDDHPLTARVAVNRFWQEIFGSGLVPTSGDFGLSGESPSHPELLDWLAVEFREQGWSVKELFRLMVTSATYRQSTRMTPEKLERDPDNVWLSRGPRYRMDAETLRDSALAVSGLLVRDIGGPSVKPYQPPGVWEAVAMRESNTHDYVRGGGEDLWRRSLYTFWKRSAPPASMEILDAPNRELCTVKRVRTNTPLQALVTLNDPQFVEAARVLAANALNEEEWVVERMDWIMRRLAARALTSEEHAVCESILADLIDHYRKRPAECAELLGVGEATASCSSQPHVHAAWTMLTNTLMNLDETVTK